MQDTRISLKEWQSWGSDPNFRNIASTLPLTFSKTEITFPTTYTNLKVLKDLADLGITFTLSYNLDEAYKQWDDYMKYIRAIEDGNPIQHKFLREYQVRDVWRITHILTNHPFNQGYNTGAGAMLLDEPRTGKTLKSIEVNEWIHKTMDVKRTIFVTPASLTYNIQSQASNFHETDYDVISGMSKKARLEYYQNWDQGTMIISKDTFKSDWDSIPTSLRNKWRKEGLAVFVDEAHFLRNYKGMKDTKQIKSLMELANISAFRIVMTGSVTSNHTKDFFGLLRFCFPHIFRKKWEFMNRYFHVYKEYFGAREITTIGATRQECEEDLFTIKEGVSTQRLQKEVMTWSNELDKDYIYLKMPAKQQKIYDMMAKEGVISVQKGKLTTKSFFPTGDGRIVSMPENAMNKITRLKQISNDALTILSTQDPYDMEARELLITKSSKTDFIIEWLKDNPDEQLIIVSFFKGYLDMLNLELQQHGIDSYAFVGGLPTAELEQAKADFQAKKIRVLCGQTTVIGTGHTLDSCNTIIFTDLDWNPEQNKQVEARILDTIDRGKNPKSVMVLVNEGTFDTKIIKALEEKWELSKLLKEVNYVQK